MIRVPANELNATSSPWPFSAWGMDVIGPIEPGASNGHRFILVAKDYFTKWVEAASYKAVTKKVVADFVRDRIVCRFRLPNSIITDNAANLNSDLMIAMCETFKIKHHNSTAYRPQMNGDVEAANKNIKQILRKMLDNYKQWHKKLPFSLLRYRTTVCTSTGATPYLLVYGTEVVIPVDVEIPSLRIIQEADLSDAEWVRRRYEQLALIDGKRMNTGLRTKAKAKQEIQSTNQPSPRKTYDFALDAGTMNITGTSANTYTQQDQWFHSRRHRSVTTVYPPLSFLIAPVPTRTEGATIPPTDIPVPPPASNFGVSDGILGELYKCWLR
nr:uncharacterized protein LOC108945512 [Nicotiana tomentosiformis]